MYTNDAYYLKKCDETFIIDNDYMWNVIYYLVNK